MGMLIAGILRGLGAALLVLLAAAFLLLLVRVRVRAAYGDGAPSLSVQYGPVKLRLFPRKEGGPDAPARERPPGRKKPKKEKPQKSRAKITPDQILYSLETLPPILARAARRTGRSIRVGPLKLYVLAAGSDPADTALLYGRLTAAVAAGLPPLERAFRLKDPDVRVYLDFTGRKMDAITDVGLSLRPVSLVWMALRAGGSLLRWYFAFRKLAPPPGREPKEREAA